MLNQVILIGALDKLEKSSTAKGTQVLNFTVETEEHYNDQVFKSWHRCKAYGQSANVDVTKGTQVLVNGKLKTDTWNDKTTGKKQYMTYVQVLQVLPVLGSTQETFDEFTG